MRMAATGDAGKLQLIQKGLTLLYQVAVGTIQETLVWI